MKALFASLLTLSIWLEWHPTTATTHLTRPFVINDFVLNSGVMAFYTRNDGNVYISQQAADDQPWSEWVSLGPNGAIGQGVKILSSPVGVHTSKNLTRILAMASNGQVYSILQNPVQRSKPSAGRKLRELESNSISDNHKVNASPTFGKWIPVGNSSLPFEAKISLSGLDLVQAGNWKKINILVFARSMTSGPNLYWCKGDEAGNFDTWARIGGSKPHLATDVTVIYNRFSGYYEAFAIANDTDGKLQHAWQENGNAWHDWTSMDYLMSPDFSKLSRPTANSLSPDFFNGALEVFGIGRDGHIHHMFQTTCDHVDNPWGYCTWGVWHSTDSVTPGKENWSNVIMAGNNIHQGNEVFSLDQNGQVWHIYQLARGDSWSKWIQVTGLTPDDKIISLPYVTRNPQQWWRIYAVTTENKMKMIEQNRTIAAKPGKAAFGSNVTVSWSVPKDEATHQDWIGVYPHGTTDDKYVDFRYVQGTQNPRKDPVPTGSIKMNMYLTDGSYDIRYLVNKRFINVVNTQLVSYNGTKDSEWLQLYHGIFIGLGAKSTNVEECIEDGETTLETFKKSFDAFENREVFNGLKLFATALEDVQKTLEKCLETDIAKALEKFIKDLVSCTESKCEKFAIDSLKFLVILYEDLYEIYGDIYAATNAFNLIQAYQQGGLCIGRVVQACVSMPA